MPAVIDATSREYQITMNRRVIHRSACVRCCSGWPTSSTCIYYAAGARSFGKPDLSQPSCIRRDPTASRTTVPRTCRRSQSHAKSAAVRLNDAQQALHAHRDIPEPDLTSSQNHHSFFVCTTGFTSSPPQMNAILQIESCPMSCSRSPMS